MQTIKKGCCKTKAVVPKTGHAMEGSMSFLSTVLLILLPKCPLCMTAYMSALVLFFDVEQSTLVPFLLHAKPVIGLVIISLIILNNKGRKTAVALGIAIVALFFLVLKTYYFTAVFPDWLLYVAFIFAIWYNGNFWYFYRFMGYVRKKQKEIKKTAVNH